MSNIVVSLEKVLVKTYKYFNQIKAATYSYIIQFYTVATVRFKLGFHLWITCEQLF